MGQILHTYLWILVVLLLSASITALDTQKHIDRTSKVGWGPWTAWSECSKTCGYGTVYRIRHCHSLHQSNSSDPVCQGLSKQYKLCLLRNCSHGETDYRMVECSMYNNALYGHKTHTWIPYINSLAPCELSCKSADTDYFARFQKTIADFVICNEENTAVCIQGQCVESGCDEILGSGVYVDRCGVCGGDGTTCRVIRGIFTRAHLSHRGYNTITTIPEGARSINITEMSSSNNHLALSTASGYFLNGGLRLQLEGIVKGAGTTFSYGKGIGQWCPGECLTAPGPLNTSVRAELIYSSRNVGIYYYFTVPREQIHNVSTSVTSLRDVGSKLHRLEDSVNYESDTGKGSFIPKIKHSKSPIYLPDAKMMTPMRQHEVSDNEKLLETSPLDQSSDSVQYNDHAYSHDNRQYSLTSAALPSPGTSHDKPRHVTDFKHSNSKHEELADHSSTTSQEFSAVGNHLLTGDISSINYIHYYHTNEHDDVGDVPMALPLHDDNSQNQGSVFNSPTNLNEYRHPERLNQSFIHPSIVGAQIQKQLAIDQDSPRSNFQRAYNGFDNSLPRHADDRLMYSWRVSGFKVCSEPCGGGLQETRVVCVKRDSQLEVMKENCEMNSKPESTIIVCNNHPCDVRWEIGDWGPCSVTCGRGLQNRSIECKQRVSPTLTLSVPISSCEQPQPQGRQVCQLDPCFTWKVSNWSKCSSECGFGQRTRTISCVDAAGDSVNGSLCTQDKPLVEVICDMGSCAWGWFHTRWSHQCSSECGRGYYTRQVYCSAADGTRLNEKKCSSQEKRPSERKICQHLKPCGGRWFSGPWSQCSATCGPDTFKRREILCVKHRAKKLNQIVKEHNCRKEDKPSQVEPCGPFPECKPQWFVMSWTECSKSCNTGVQTREVKCLDSFFTPSPDCDKKTKPSRRQPCNTQLCIEKDAPDSAIPLTTRNEALQMDLSDRSVDSYSICDDSQSFQWCQMAKQARLCNYTHYQRICCHTCRNVDPNSIL